MKTSALGITALSLLATPAGAHVGDHGGMTLSQLAEHFFETDHIVFAVLIVVAAVLAYRAGRRAEARAVAKARRGAAAS